MCHRIAWSKGHLIVSAGVVYTLGAAAACQESPITPNLPNDSATVAFVTVGPSEHTFEALGDTVHLNALALDSALNPILNQLFGWTSSDETVVSVDNAGVVTAVADGSAVVSATTGGVGGGATIIVKQKVVTLAFAAAPTLGRAEEALAPVRVELLDARDHLVVNATDVIELALDSSPAGAGLSGDLNVAPANGVAEFTDLAIDAPGRGFTLRASTDSLEAQSEPFTVTLRFASIATGGPHTCALTRTGRAYCWGRNASGQLGDGTTQDRFIPTPVADDYRFESLVVGHNNTCGIEQTSLYCWGDNDRGSFGNGNETNSLTPVPSGGGLALRQVGPGEANHRCGVAVDGSGFCWGENDHHELGDGTDALRLSPVLTGGGHHFISITVGRSHSCAVSIANDAYCWGSHREADGVIGDGTIDERSFPTLVIGGHAFVSVIAGRTGTCALTTDADVYCWGLNVNSVLGVGLNVENVLAPALVVGGVKFQSVSVGGFSHTCALTVEGLAYCWGNLPQVNGVTVAPTHVAVDYRFVSLSAGGGTACGVTPDGDAYCWGYNTWGQLGDGTTNTSNEPVRVLPEGL